MQESQCRLLCNNEQTHPPTHPHARTRARTHSRHTLAHEGAAEHVLHGGLHLLPVPDQFQRQLCCAPGQGLDPALHLCGRGGGGPKDTPERASKAPKSIGGTRNKRKTPIGCVRAPRGLPHWAIHKLQHMIAHDVDPFAPRTVSDRFGPLSLPVATLAD